MAVFGGMTLTNKGLVLQGKAQAGIQLNYTRIAIGDGSLSGQSVPALNTLISPKKSLPVARLQMQPPNKVIIGTTLSNADVTTGFYFREVGVFAQDPDAGEILYAYANAGVTADYIAPGGGTDIIEKAFDCVVVVGTAANITASIDDSLIFALQKDLDAVSASKVDKISGKGLSANDYTTAEKNKLAGITAGAGGAGSASDAVIGNRTISDTTAPAGDTGTITSLFGWLANMIKSITGKSSWRTAPATTLEAAKTHADDATRHLTAAERTAWNAKETTTGAQAKADAAQAAAATDATTKANAAQAAAATDAAAKANTVQANVTSHTGNTTVHITAAERTTWNAKASTTAATTSTPGLMAAADKAKLDGVAAGANNYTHPAAHPPSIIVQDANNRFVTDAEKNTWNAKASTATATASTAGLMSAADKTLLNNNTGFGTTSGIATAYTITLSPAPTALVAGLKFSFISHITSGANPTLNPNALGAKPIKKSNGNAATLALNGVYTVVYDGTAFQLQGEGGEYGTATAGDVLKGKTIGTENGVIPGKLSLSPPGIEWLVQEVTSPYRWYSVCYGNGMFVAVGENAVMKSQDGINWNITVSTYNFESVGYGNGMFVAVAKEGFNGQVLTSIDGINWTIQATHSSRLESVCYGNGLFVVVGDRVVMTSRDSFNWKSVIRPDDDWRHVCYGNGLFVAVGYDFYHPGKQVMTSNDGINWTLRNSVEGTYWYGVCYGNGLFVAVGYNGEMNGNQVMTSPDGINWTSRVSAEDNSWNSVCYASGLFVAVAAGSSSHVMTSPDGKDWTVRDVDYRQSWYSVCYGNGTLVAVSNLSYLNQVMTSTSNRISNYIVTMDKFKESISNTLIDVGSNFSTPNDSNNMLIDNIRSLPMVRAGAIWELQTTPTIGSWKSVCYGNGIFVIVNGAYNGSTTSVLSSTDGINWTESTMTQASWSSICHGKGLFVAVGRYNIATSPDGINWTVRNSPNSYWKSVCFGNGRFVAIGTISNSDIHGATSTDGINWTAMDISEANWSSVCYGNGIFVAVQNVGAGIIATSSNGINWATHTAPISSNSICYGNGLFVAPIAYNNHFIFTSIDGINWDEHELNISEAWDSVCYGSGLFVAVRRSFTNRVMTSPNGINWTERSSPGDGRWGSVCYGNNRFVAVADSGTSRVMISRRVD